MMQSPKPAPFNVVPGDTTGTTWALPKGAIVRFGKGVRASSPSLDSIALSPDATYFAAGTGMGLWFYDVSTMLPITLWETERGLISAVDISTDGRLIAIANWDGSVKVMDVQSGEIITQMERYELSSFVDFLVFSPDGRLVASALWQQGVEVLDVQNGECITQIQLEPINAKFNIYAGIEFSPNGQYLAVTETPINADNGGYTPSRDGSQTAVWNSWTGALVTKFLGKKFAFSPDSRLIACACPADTAQDDDDLHQLFISIWDIATSKRVAYFKAHEHWIDSVTFSPCGHFIVSADRSGNLRVWEIQKGARKEDWTHNGIDARRWEMDYWDAKWYNPEFRMTRLVPSYSLEGELFAVVFPDTTNTVEVWNIERREKLKSIERLPGSIGSTWLAKCPALAIACSLHNTSENSDKTNGRVTLREPTFRPRTDSDLDSMRFSRDGQTIVSDSYGGGSALWEIPQKHKQSFVAKLQAKINRVKYSDAARKKTFATLTSEQKTEQKQAWETLKTDPRFTSIDWSKKTDSRTYSITVSPDGNIIATGHYGEIRLWNIEEPIPLDAIPQPENSTKPYALAFSPCGKYLASGTWWQGGMAKMAIRLWEVATGKNIHTFWGHTTDVQSLDFSPDGTFLASGSFDGTILLWDVKPFTAV